MTCNALHIHKWLNSSGDIIKKYTVLYLQDLTCNRPDLYSKGFNLQAAEMHVSRWKWELLPFQVSLSRQNIFHKRVSFLHFFFKQTTFTLLTEAKIRSSHWKQSYPILTVGDGDSHEKCWCYLKSWLCNHIFALPRKDLIHLSEEYRGRRKVWCHCLSTTYQCEKFTGMTKQDVQNRDCSVFYSGWQFLLIMLICL